MEEADVTYLMENFVGLKAGKGIGKVFLFGGNYLNIFWLVCRSTSTHCFFL